MRTTKAEEIPLILLIASTVDSLHYSLAYSCVSNDWFYYYPSQDETSEEFIGEWAETRGIRDQLFIATKVLMPLLPNFYHFFLRYKFETVLQQLQAPQAERVSTDHVYRK